MEAVPKENPSKLPLAMRNRSRSVLLLGTLAFVAVGLSACKSVTLKPYTLPPVDVNKFMGDWYVIANIPTPFVKNAYNAVQNYELQADGTVATTFTYREGGFDGKLKTLKPRGYINDDPSHASWGLQFGPILAEYLIAYVSPDYSEAIIARTSRDFVWIMARTPTIPDAEYDQLVDKITAWGYDTEKLEKVPQRW
jgi:apolipoprotein D and lipocalin family protein